MAAAGGLRGGTAAPTPWDTDHVLCGTARQGLVPISIAEKYVCHRYLMHPEAPIKNKNI